MTTKAKSSEIFLAPGEIPTVNHILDTATYAALSSWADTVPVSVHHAGKTETQPNGGARHFVHAVSGGNEKHLPGFMAPQVIEVDVFPSTEKDSEGRWIVQADECDADYPPDCAACIDLLRDDWKQIDPMGLITGKAGSDIASWLALASERQ